MHIAQVDYLAKGVEIWLVLASAGVFIASFFNLLYGLPKTHRDRRRLLPYLLSRPNDPSMPTAGRSYAVPAREGSFLPAARDAVEALNRGIEEEQRQLKSSEAMIMKMKIMKANMGPLDVSRYLSVRPVTFGVDHQTDKAYSVRNSLFPIRPFRKRS